MAIAGSGGWLPSKGVRFENGHLVWQSLCQNKPKDIIEQDMKVAARTLVDNPGETIQVHLYGTNAIELARYVREMTNGSG